MARVSGSGPRRAAARRTAAYPSRGFTLIEMLVVVLIVGILASAAVPLAELNRRREKESELRQALRTLRQAIDAYKDACEGERIRCAKSPLDGPASVYPPNLEVLVEGAEDSTPSGGGAKGAIGQPKRVYFLRRLPRDPFADADIPAAQTWALRSYDSPPDAPAPGEDVFDVASKSDGTGLNGIPYTQW